MLFVLLNACSTTKITWDKIQKDDIRHIGTEGLDMKIDDAFYRFSLTSFSDSNYKEYFLLINSTSRIENKSVVLLKLGNDETIKLTSDTIKITKVDWPVYNPIVGGTRPYTLITKEKVDYYASIYLLKEDVLEKIEQHGILKIRIEYKDTYKEKSWNIDMLGIFIKDCHESIERKLRKSPDTYKSIEDNF